MVRLIEKGFGRSPAGGTSCSDAPYIYGFISLMVHILVYTNNEIARILINDKSYYISFY